MTERTKNLLRSMIKTIADHYEGTYSLLADALKKTGIRKKELIELGMNYVVSATSSSIIYPFSFFEKEKDAKIYADTLVKKFQAVHPNFSQDFLLKDKYSERIIHCEAIQVGSCKEFIEVRIIPLTRGMCRRPNESKTFKNIQQKNKGENR